MRVLVTGSAGFVGQHLVRSLIARGDVVHGVDLKCAGMANDLSDEHVAHHAMRIADPDVIVHLASSCSTLGSISRPTETFTNTVVTAVNVLESARERQIPVILTSSVKARDGMTPYGASKVMAETWALEYERTYGVPLVINRPGTIYGPGQDGSTESGWIAWFVKAKEEGIKVTINGSGEQTRDLLHVNDYVRLLVTQIDGFERYRGEIWDVGGGMHNAVTVHDIVDYLDLEHDHGPDRPGDARMYVAKNDVPGWEPVISWLDSETLGALGEIG